MHDGTGVLGDEDFDRLYRDSWHAMVQMATLLTMNRSAAEDVVQQAFMGTYRRWSRMTDIAGAAAYARTAVVNGARSHHRRVRTRRMIARSREARADHEAVPGPSAEDDGLRDAVAALPRRQREVVVLRYWLDLSEADIAHALQISPGTVKSNATRALSRLQHVMGEAS